MMGNCGVFKSALLFVVLILLGIKDHMILKAHLMFLLFFQVYIYKKKVSNQDQQNLRYECSRKRQSLEFNSNSTVPTNACQNVVKDNDLLCGLNQTISVCTQVTFDVEEIFFVFNCEFEGNNAGTQVTIPNNFISFNKPQSEDKSSGVVIRQKILFIV